MQGRSVTAHRWVTLPPLFSSNVCLNRNETSVGLFGLGSQSHKGTSTIAVIKYVGAGGGAPETDASGAAPVQTVRKTKYTSKRPPSKIARCYTRRA